MSCKNVNDPGTLDELLRADLRAGCLPQREGKISRQHFLRCPPYHVTRSKEMLEILRRYEAMLTDMQRTGSKSVD